MTKKREGKHNDAAGAEPALKHNPFAALSAIPREALPEQAKEAARPEKAPLATKSARGRLVLRRETKHRGGKAVVVVSGFGSSATLSPEETLALAQELKQKLGCGGTLEERGDVREIVLQGDRPAQVAELLRARGFRVDGVTK